MAARRTKVAAPRKTTAKKSTTKRAAKPASTRKPPTRRSTSKVTLASIAAQLTALTERVDELTALVRGKSEQSERNVASVAPPPSSRGISVRDFSSGVGAPLEDAVDGALMAIDPARFEADLLETLTELDRRGRHSGMVPIPEVRQAFVERGWTRRAFDARLLQAERDFVVDLKTANDPARLSAPELAIEEPGRGHLQYVVLR